MTPREKLFALLNEYGPLAIEHLTLTNIRREDEMELEWEKVKLNFLFPTLDSLDRLFILAVFSARRGYNQSINNPEAKPESVNELERIFMERKQTLLAADFYSALTPLQKEILQTDYLTVRFRER